jgi:hypothetical protein
MFNKASYAFYILGGLRNFLAFENASLVLNGAYWIILPLIPAFQGIIMSRRSIAGRATGWVPHPLPFLAPFYALVSVHYQHPTYLYYTVSVSLVALLWLTADGNRLRRLTIMSMTCALAVIALQFHAAQPLTRGRLGVIAGARTAEPSMSVNIQRLGLDIGAKDQRRYQHLIALIERETAPDEPIFVLPANAELYFLTRRRNPFRFLNTAIGVTNEAELASVLKALAERPPKLVIFNSRDVTNNAFSRRIMAFVESRYVRLEISRPFEIYRLDPGR